MSKILGIVTVFVLVAAALVALKNNTKFKEEISNRDTSLVKLAKSQEELAVAQGILRDLPIETEGVNKLSSAKEEEKAVAQEANMQAQEEIEMKTAKVQSNSERLDLVRQKAEKVGDIKSLAGRMKEMRFELEELGQSITAKEANLANLTAQTTATKADSSRRKDELDLMSKGESLPGLKTRISRVYPTWGFVTLADGNNKGVIGNSTLDVVRGDEVVAKLLVTAVENSSASASIIPDSISEGTQVRVGDRVVPGSKVEPKTVAVGN